MAPRSSRTRYSGGVDQLAVAEPIVEVFIDVGGRGYGFAVELEDVENGDGEFFQLGLGVGVAEDGDDVKDAVALVLIGRRVDLGAEQAGFYFGLFEQLFGFLEGGQADSGRCRRG